MAGGDSKAAKVGLMVLRVGVGVLLLLHGWPKVVGGTEMWAKLGAAIGLFGITFAPVFWGFMATMAEALGGVCLALGILTRPFAAMVVIEMVVATRMHLGHGDGFLIYSHAILMGVVALSILISGGGPYSLGAAIGPMKGKWFQ